MNITGILKKMQTKLDHPVSYFLSLGEERVPLNASIGHTLTLHHTGAIYCIACQRKIKKSFNQGYCYPCFTRLAECDTCIIKPELCHYAAGTCRQPAWGEAHCMQDHYVYLANSSGVKIGITRHTQVPTRWIDQGAIAALAILKVSSRYVSGLVEVMGKQYLADKTHWQKMLKGNIAPIDLVAKQAELLSLIQPELAKLQQDSEANIEVLQQAVTNIHYPVLRYPEKIKSLNFDKEAQVSGQLLGIKGQYLLFDTGVINLRKFAGYQLTFRT